MLSKKGSFFELINHQKPDIILGCETWLNEIILNSEILPCSYNAYWNDRDDGYGGTLIGIKSNLESQILDIHPTLEICTVSVYLSDNKQVIVICA